MASIKEIPTLAFATSVDAVTIATDADINVRTVLTADDGSVVFDNTSKYSPSAGSVTIEGIDELVNSAVLSLVDTGAMLATGPRGSGMGISVTAGDASAASRLLYASHFIGDVSPRFATQIRDRKVYKGQHVPLSVITAGQELKILAGLAYRDATGVKYAEKEIGVASTRDCYSLDVGVESILSVIQPESCSADSVIFYTLTLCTADGAQCDKLRCTLSGLPRQARQFVFMNLYGVPDTFTFSGKDTEKQTLESDFGYAGREYVRLDPLLTESHEANSGWVTAEELSTVYDILESRFVFVVDGDELHRVVVTDADCSVSRPANEPDAVSLTWRYADARYMRKPHAVPTAEPGHVFTRPPFDKTFD